MDSQLDGEGREEAQAVLREFPALLGEAFADVRMQKLGFSFWEPLGGLESLEKAKASRTNTSNNINKAQEYGWRTTQTAQQPTQT